MQHPQKSLCWYVSLSLLHVLTHFIPQIGRRSKRYDNKHTPPPPKKKKKKKTLKERNEMKYRIIMLFLLPSVLSGCHHQYNFNTPAVLTEAKPTFEQREWPYVEGNVMGAKSTIEAFRKDPF